MNRRSIWKILPLVIILCMGMIASIKADPLSGAEEKLESLFQALSKSKNSDDAEILISRIWQIWISNNDDDGNIKLMHTGIYFMSNGHHATAEDLFSHIIMRDPSYTEAWNKRATVRFLQGNLHGSEHDIYEVLKREPRHFGAMSGLGAIKFNQEKYEDALIIYKTILTVNPNSSDAARMIPKLEAILRGGAV